MYKHLFHAGTVQKLSGSRTDRNTFWEIVKLKLRSDALLHCISRNSPMSQTHFIPLVMSARP